MTIKKRCLKAKKPDIFKVIAVKKKSTIKLLKKKEFNAKKISLLTLFLDFSSL